jgi:hypothetical protein
MERPLSCPSAVRVSACGRPFHSRKPLPDKFQPHRLGSFAGVMPADFYSIHDDVVAATARNNSM